VARTPGGRGLEVAPDYSCAVRVVETFVRGKANDDAACEDVVVVTETHAAIFDGASLAGLGPAGQTGGRFAATTLAEALSAVPGDADFAAASAELSEMLDQRIRSAIGTVRKRDRPRSAGVIYSDARREVWRVGDSHFAIGEVHHIGTLRVTEVMGAFRAVYLRLLLLSGDASVASIARSDPSIPALMPLIERFHLACNEAAAGELAFAAFDGTPIPDRFLEVVEVPQGTTRIVLASDGYPAPSSSLAEAEAHVARLLREDPLCISMHVADKGLREAMESFDDRAYVRLEA
jgi:hypothetical protein